MVRLFFCSILILLLGLLIEKLIHLDYDITGITISLKKDFGKFFHALFSQPVQRHIFCDIKFMNDLDTISQHYADKNFEIQKCCMFIKNVPSIVIRFVPAHELTDDELTTLTALLHKKFKEYVVNENLQWSSFAEYSVGADYVFVYLHYDELQCDTIPFRQLYAQHVHQKNDENTGILYDEKLESELEHVD